jgi:hypothetical protein
MRDTFSTNVEAAAHYARKDAWPDDLPSPSDLYEPPEDGSDDEDDDLAGGR